MNGSGVKGTDWIALGSLVVGLVSTIAGSLLGLRSQAVSEQTARSERKRAVLEQGRHLASSLAPTIAMLHDLDADRLIAWAPGESDALQAAISAWPQERVHLFQLWASSPLVEVRHQARDAVEAIEKCLHVGLELRVADIEGRSVVKTAEDLQEVRGRALAHLETITSLVTADVPG